MASGFSFAGHETFAFRSSWPKKAVDAVTRNQQFFSRPDAMVHLGVGKNMVESIRHWGLALGLIEEDRGTPNNRGRVLRPTEIGRRLFSRNGWDPFFEDPGTLWLFHWQLASTPHVATTWWFAFSRYRSLEFSRRDLQHHVGEFARGQNVARLADASLKRDVDCFVLTYSRSRRRVAKDEDALDCPLVDLGLIQESETRDRYQFVRHTHQSLPSSLFAFAVASYLNQRTHATPTVPVEELASYPGSPGRVFCLDEAALIAQLEGLSRTTSDALVYDETSGLKQLLVKKTVKPLAILDRYYQTGQHATTRRSRSN